MKRNQLKKISIGVNFVPHPAILQTIAIGILTMLKIILSTKKEKENRAKAKQKEIQKAKEKAKEARVKQKVEEAMVIFQQHTHPTPQPTTQKSNSGKIPLELKSKK